MANNLNASGVVTRHRHKEGVLCYKRATSLTQAFRLSFAEPAHGFAIRHGWRVDHLSLSKQACQLNMIKVDGGLALAVLDGSCQRGIIHHIPSVHDEWTKLFSKTRRQASQPVTKHLLSNKEPQKKLWHWRRREAWLVSPGLTRWASPHVEWSNGVSQSLRPITKSSVHP